MEKSEIEKNKMNPRAILPVEALSTEGRVEHLDVNEWRFVHGETLMVKENDGSVTIDMKRIIPSNQSGKEHSAALKYVEEEIDGEQINGHLVYYPFGGISYGEGHDENAETAIAVAYKDSVHGKAKTEVGDERLEHLLETFIAEVDAHFEAEKAKRHWEGSPWQYALHVGTSALRLFAEGKLPIKF